MIFGVALVEAQRLVDTYHDHDRAMLLARIGQLEAVTESLKKRVVSAEERIDVQQSTLVRVGHDRDVAEARVRVVEAESEEISKIRHRLVEELTEADEAIEAQSLTIGKQDATIDALKAKLDRGVRALGHSVIAMGELMEKVAQAA